MRVRVCFSWLRMRAGQLKAVKKFCRRAGKIAFAHSQKVSNQLDSRTTVPTFNPIKVIARGGFNPQVLYIAKPCSMVNCKARR